MKYSFKYSKKKTYLQDQKKLNGKEFPKWVVVQQMSLRHLHSRLLLSGHIIKSRQVTYLFL